jgi:hypothetical protein
VTVERYAVPVFEQEAPLCSGEGVRLTRMDVPPSAVEDAVEAFGDTAVPWLAETDGFCSAVFSIDRTTGHSVTETVWRDPGALAAADGRRPRYAWKRYWPPAARSAWLRNTSWCSVRRGSTDRLRCLPERVM